MAQGGAWIKFYPDDWNNDVNLRACSLTTQAVFIRLFAVLIRSQEYGVLCPRGDSESISRLSRVAGVTTKRLNHSLTELTENGVLKIDEKGRLYSKRMVKDQLKREKGQEHGVKGGNPALKQGYPPPLTPTLNLEAEADIEAEAEAECTRTPAREAHVDSPPRNVDDTAQTFLHHLESITTIWPVPSSKYGTPEHDTDMAELAACLDLLGVEEARRLTEIAYANSPPENRPKWLWQFKRILQDEIKRREGNGKVRRSARDAGSESDIDRKTRAAALAALGHR